MTRLYVAKEIRVLMEEAGLDPALLQVRTDHPDGVRALTVTSPEDSGGLAILPRCDYEGRAGHTNLVRTRGVLPAALQSVAEVRGHRDYDSSAELLGNRKFHRD